MPRPVTRLIMSLTAAMLGSIAVAVSGASESAKTVSEAFVTNQTGDSLSVVSLSDMKSVAEIAIGGKPAGIAMSPDGKLAYVTSPESKEVVVVDALARKVANRFKVGEAPLGIAAHPTNGRVYVADWFTHSISVVDSGPGWTNSRSSPSRCS